VKHPDIFGTCDALEAFKNHTYACGAPTDAAAQDQCVELGSNCRWSGGAAGAKCLPTQFALVRGAFGANESDSSLAAVNECVSATTAPLCSQAGRLKLLVDRDLLAELAAGNFTVHAANTTVNSTDGELVEPAVDGNTGTGRRPRAQKGGAGAAVGAGWWRGAGLLVIGAVLLL
jgi:hypothetical protein